MGIEKVRDEVIAKSKKQHAAIISEAEKEAKAIIESAEEKSREKKKKAEEETARELEELKIREMSSAELEVNKMLLETRKRIIEEAFESARQEISKMPQSTRKEHIKSLISKAKNQMEPGRVLCSEADIKHIEGLKTQAAPIIGGIIAENKDGTIRIDYSYESILDQVREKSLKDVAKILFRTD
ncbi:hypothetical protein HYU11_01410 [Candidatus Woesearchaeota archaeon]|nr:hypothetical protein [Candidatus Woesearchaeota archaeon]